MRTERYVNAILLCEGGPKLLSNPQNAYFEKGTANLHYLQLFHLITVEDLVDIIQNADLQKWIEIFVILCTFAKDGEFVGLAEQLGQRLKFAGSLRRGAEGDESRKNAALTTLQLGSSKSRQHLDRGNPKRSILCFKSRTLGLTWPQFRCHVNLCMRMCF